MWKFIEYDVLNPADLISKRDILIINPSFGSSLKLSLSSGQVIRVTSPAASVALCVDTSQPFWCLYKEVPQ